MIWWPVYDNMMISVWQNNLCHKPPKRQRTTTTITTTTTTNLSPGYFQTKCSLLQKNAVWDGCCSVSNKWIGFGNLRVTLLINWPKLVLFLYFEEIFTFWLNMSWLWAPTWHHQQILENVFSDLGRCIYIAKNIMKNIRRNQILMYPMTILGGMILFLVIINMIESNDDDEKCV